MAPPGHFRVIIVGGGIAGLALGVMLERAGVDFYILEAAAEMQSLGGVVFLGPPLMRVMEQLGLLDDLIRHSHKMSGVTVHNHRLAKISRFKLDYAKDRYGYNALTIARPKLYDILISRVPAYRVLFSKRVISTSQTHEGIKVRCEDGSIFSGDILVGADGGGSSVREHVYNHVQSRSKKHELLTKHLQAKHEQLGVVGVTRPLDSRLFPALDNGNGELKLVMPKHRNCVVWFVPITERRLGWGITSASPSSSAKGSYPGDRHGSRASLDDMTEPMSPTFDHPSRAGSTLSSASFSPPPSLPSSPISTSSNAADYLENHYGSNDNYGLRQSRSTTFHSMGLNNHGGSSTSSNYPPVSGSGGATQGRSVRKRQSFGRLSKTSTSSSESPSKSSRDKYPAVLYMNEGPATLTQSDLMNSSLRTPPRCSSWGVLDERICIEDSIRDQICPFGGTVGEIIDSTAKNMITTINIEEKYYPLWYFGRTVLIGDACHKFLPSSGRGTTQAILDAIVLASLLADLPSNSLTDIEALFQVYYERRGTIAKSCVESSQQLANLLFNRDLTAKFIRKMSSTWISEWFLVKMSDRQFESRPILPYLKTVPDHGKIRNRDSNIPLQNDKRFVMARRKSISTVESYCYSGSERNGEEHHGLGMTKTSFIDRTYDPWSSSLSPSSMAALNLNDSFNLHGDYFGHYDDFDHYNYLLDQSFNGSGGSQMNMGNNRKIPPVPALPKTQTTANIGVKTRDIL